MNCLCLNPVSCDIRICEIIVRKLQEVKTASIGIKNIGYPERKAFIGAGIPEVLKTSPPGSGYGGFEFSVRE